MTRALLLLTAAAVLLPGCEATDQAATAPAEANMSGTADPAADEQAIRGNVDRWLQHIKAKDAAAIAQFYTEDGTVMPPNMPIGKGRAAVQKVWADMMATPGFELTFQPEQIIVSASGDMALDRGTYRLTVSPGGTQQTDTGKYLVVWRKVGGEWKAAADMFNSDLPAAGA